MHAKIERSRWKTGLLYTSLLVLTPIAAATEPPETFQVVEGVAIYLGVMPVQIVRGHAAESEEAKMHGGVPAGRYRDHVVVALFDGASARRIEDARVTAAVAKLGLGPERKTLEPMHINDSVTYGNYFEMPNSGIYRIDLRLEIPGHPRAIEAAFTHRHDAPSGVAPS